jgi:hypothetical protein
LCVELMHNADAYLRHAQMHNGGVRYAHEFFWANFVRLIILVGCRGGVFPPCWWGAGWIVFYRLRETVVEG